MFDESKNYWLYIAPYVYCNIKKDKALLYNTNNGSSLETCIPENIELLLSLHDKENMGALYIEGTILSNNDLKEFISEFCNKNMGGVVDITQERLKPIQMMPILNLQRDIERLRKNNILTSNSSLGYLLELNIYINTTCLENCCFCDNYYMQNLCCHSSCKDQELEIDNLQNILYQIRFSSVGKINILGGDIFKYSHYNQLISLLLDFHERIHIWNHYSNFNNINKTLLEPWISYHVIVTLPYNETIVKNCINTLQNQTTKYHFYFTTEDEYNQIEHIIQTFKIENYNLHPIFTGNNGCFFEQHIFTTKEEILDDKITFREIFARQKLNTLSFGTLTILPTGETHANLNEDSLGNITNQEIVTIIHKELTENTAWRRIRDSYPCSKCLFQYLCQSPSNYERIMNRPNLCHIECTDNAI